MELLKAVAIQWRSQFENPERRKTLCDGNGMQKEIQKEWLDVQRKGPMVAKALTWAIVVVTCRTKERAC